MTPVSTWVSTILAFFIVSTVSTKFMPPMSAGTMRALVTRSRYGSKFDS